MASETENEGGRYDDLAVVDLRHGSVQAVHKRTGWKSPPVANEKAARSEFDRYVDQNPDAADAEPTEEYVPPGPLSDASDEELLAEVDRRDLLRDAEAVPSVDDSISNQLGWVNAVKHDDEAYRKRAELILSRELERPEDDQRKTLKSALTDIVEAEPESGGDDDGDGDGSPPDGASGE